MCGLLLFVLCMMWAEKVGTEDRIGDVPGDWKWLRCQVDTGALTGVQDM